MQKKFFVHKITCMWWENTLSSKKFNVLLWKLSPYQSMLPNMTLSSPFVDVAALKDMTTTAGKIADFKARRVEAGQPMGAKALDKVKQAGRLTARERLDYLLDEGSFIETDQLARHRTFDFGMHKNALSPTES